MREASGVITASHHDCPLQPFVAKDSSYAQSLKKPVRIQIVSSRRGGPSKWRRDLVKSIRGKGDNVESVEGVENSFLEYIRHNPDIVHTTVPWVKVRRNTNIVMTIHGDFRVERLQSRLVYPTGIALSDCITLPSYYLKDALGIEDAVIIPNAVHLDEYPFVERPERERPRILTVTSFQFYEKSLGIINAVGTLARIIGERDLQLEYFVVGGGRYLQRIVKETRHLEKSLGIEFVHFLGHRKNVLDEYRNSDVLIHYSTLDNFPISIIEAMATGLPVLANPVGAIPEIITNGDNGYILQDCDDAMSKIVPILENVDMRRQLGKRAREIVERDYSWRVVIENYYRIYERILQ